MPTDMAWVVRVLRIGWCSSAAVGAALLSRADVSSRVAGGVHELIDCVRCLPRSVKALASSPLESIIISCTMPTDRLPPSPQLEALTEGVLAIGRELEVRPEAYEVVLRKTLAKVLHEGASQPLTYLSVTVVEFRGQGTGGPPPRRCSRCTTCSRAAPRTRRASSTAPSASTSHR